MFEAHPASSVLHSICAVGSACKFVTCTRAGEVFEISKDRWVICRTRQHYSYATPLKTCLVHTSKTCLSAFFWPAGLLIESSLCRAGRASFSERFSIQKAARYVIIFVLCFAGWGPGRGLGF